MQLTVKLLVADDHPQVLEGLLTLVSRKSDEDPSVSSLPVADLEAVGSLNGSAGNHSSANFAVDPHRIAVEIVIIRRQLLDAISNIVKSGKTDAFSSEGAAYAVLSPAAATPTLSKREKDVLLLIAGGMATKEIAYALSISPKTVDFHRDNIKKKTGLRSGAQLTRYAIEQGWG